ncbi:hypothetical protein [Undibacterium terreum]|uniref:Uncharacterized protein n=1 Tax=Undibacterium terreum TaxID=1224302 RepID=A0A916U8T2_9BURK|nr:hypothetical protein [Undibacterium terreum]GGC63357.1 hypothetical protein GCM10011396_07880 [Undibacterium terreum]
MKSVRTFVLGKSSYDPNRLLNAIKEKLQLRDDAALSRVLAISRPLVWEIRRHTVPVGAWLLMRMQEVSQLSVEELRFLMGDRRQRIRVAIPQRNFPRR